MKIWQDFKGCIRYRESFSPLNSRSECQTTFIAGAENTLWVGAQGSWVSDFYSKTYLKAFILLSYSSYYHISCSIIYEKYKRAVKVLADWELWLPYEKNFLEVVREIGAIKPWSVVHNEKAAMGWKPGPK